MKDYKYIITRNVLAGANTTSLKTTTEHFGEMGFLIARQIIIFIIILFLGGLKTSAKIFFSLTRKEKIILVGFNGISMLSVFIVLKALNYIPISVFFLMEQSILMLISIFVGVVFLKEKITKVMVTGLFIMMFGMFLVMRNGQPSSEQTSIIGVLMLIFYALIISFSSALTMDMLNYSVLKYRDSEITT